VAEEDKRQKAVREAQVPGMGVAAVRAFEVQSRNHRLGRENSVGQSLFMPFIDQVVAAVF